jgi:hypothetical protein
MKRLLLLGLFASNLVYASAEYILECTLPEGSETTSSHTYLLELKEEKAYVLYATHKQAAELSFNDDFYKIDTHLELNNKKKKISVTVNRLNNVYTYLESDSFDWVGGKKIQIVGSCTIRAYEQKL